MNKELALRTFAYLIRHYKTHNATIINKQEIEAIEFILNDNEFLEQQLHDASIRIQELIEEDIWCPSNCEKLEKLQQENKQLKDNWNKLKEDLINDINYWHEQEKEWSKLGFIKFGGEANSKIIFKKVLDKMQELEQGSDNDE
jgi:hypothetical protein